MKIFWLLILLVHTCFAKRLISAGEIETLFKKFMSNDLVDWEKTLLADVFEILYRPEYVSSKSLEESTEIRATIDCIVCRSAAAALFEGVAKGQTDEQITNSLTVLCTAVGMQKLNVCKGAVGLNVPILTYIIKTTPEASPETFCGLVMQTADNPNVCPFNDSRFEWQVVLPEPSNITSPNVEIAPYKIALITDAHLDPLYEAFGVGNCGEPTCCRKGQVADQSYNYISNVDESVIKESIVKRNEEIVFDLEILPKIQELKKSSRNRFTTTSRNNEPAGYWGDYRNCDTPIWAYDNVIDTIAKNHKDIDMIYYIGDTIDHGVWETTYDLINEMNAHVVNKIKKSFGDTVKVVPVIGNHESQPTNQFAPSRVNVSNLNTTWLYNALANKWDSYLTEDAKATLMERGDFSLKVRPGLRVISLNNNVAYKMNWWLLYDPLDAKKHLDWLIEELHKAEIAGEYVHILSHIPPGVPDLIHTWTREYNRIINRFSSIISGEFNGHVHSDEFKIFYNSDGAPINVAWGAGSATSYTNYNLNYKIVTFNETTFEPRNIENYVYNLTEANLRPNRDPHWFQLYDMKHRFKLNDLSASSLDNLVHQMVTDNKFYLELYSAFFSKLSDTRWPHCDDNCRLNNLCKAVITVLWERENCEKLVNLFHGTI